MAGHRELLEHCETAARMRIKKGRGKKMDTKIRVMLADASAEFRLLLREALEETGEFQVVGETGDGSQVAGLVA